LLEEESPETIFSVADFVLCWTFHFPPLAPLTFQSALGDRVSHFVPQLSTYIHAEYPGRGAGGRGGTGFTVPLVALILKGILNAGKAVESSDKTFKI
jgi:hypothetical protein